MSTNHIEPRAVHRGKFLHKYWSAYSIVSRTACVTRNNWFYELQGGKSTEVMEPMQNAATLGFDSRSTSELPPCKALSTFGRFIHSCATAQGAPCFQYLYQEHCLKPSDRMSGVGWGTIFQINPPQCKKGQGTWWIHPGIRLQHPKGIR
jgi:hypothetical protein